MTEQPENSNSALEIDSDSPLSEVTPRKDNPIIINCTISPKILAALKAKKMNAFVPVSAAERIWAEALVMPAEKDETGD